jgi:hypothetical protein
MAAKTKDVMKFVSMDLVKKSTLVAILIVKSRLLMGVLIIVLKVFVCQMILVAILAQEVAALFLHPVQTDAV